MKEQIKQGNVCRMNISQEMLDVLMDVIVDYPMCADESPFADMDRVNENVGVLKKLHLALRIELEIDSSIANKD